MIFRDLKKKFSKKADELRGKSPYEVLGVSRDASLVEVRDAYRRLMKTYHPDISDDFLKKSNEEMAKTINSAYEKIVRERENE